MEAVSTAGKDRYVVYEGTLPFAKSMVYGFIKNVREAAEKNEGDNKEYVTLEHLQEELITKAWESLSKDKSKIRRFLDHELLKYEFENADDAVQGALDVQKLEMLGLLLCQGEFREKTQVFWDLLQDGGQEFISASDKDYKPCFTALCELCTVFELQVAKEIDGIECPYSQDDMDAMRDCFEDVLEDHLDELFDFQSKMQKEEWLKALAEKTPYLFSSSELRKKVIEKAGLDIRY